MSDDTKALPAAGSLFADTGGGKWYVMTEEVPGRAIDVAKICDANGFGEKEARLFAAAPDLLAALQKLVSERAAYDGEVSCDALDTATAAIAKATGAGPDQRDAEIAALVAENEALHEKLSRKDEACNSTINAALMMPDPVHGQLVSRAAVDSSVPQGFIDYVQANYNGVVDIHRPEWHAKRLWNAAMRHVSPAAVAAGARDVLAERQRQVDVKDWTPEHDDYHLSGEIAAFAAVYAMPPAARSWPASETGYGPTFGTALCPEDWQPKFGDRRRELVKAGALILAEIERIDRATANGAAGVTP